MSSRKIVSRSCALALLSALCTCVIGGVRAQTPSEAAIGAGVGVATVTMTAQGRSASAQGLTLHAAVGILEVEVQPFAVTDPSRAERFSSVYALVGSPIPVGGAAFLRPTIGVQFRKWSGPDRARPTDRGLAFGAVAGWTFLANYWRLTPQIEWRYGFIKSEGHVHSQLLGIRLQVGR